MGEMIFNYGIMGCGKSSIALQYADNLRRARNKVQLLTTLDRSGTGLITSRIGLSDQATFVKPGDQLDPLIEGGCQYAIFDEAQFLTTDQVSELFVLTTIFQNLSVHAYGLRTDYRGELFEGTKRFFELADECREIPMPMYCWCGYKALFNARVEDGEMMWEGEPVIVGDFDPQTGYVNLCRKHYLEGKAHDSFSR